jgi:diguanylate cyclase (GGDEF)-like protein/PAS domain S-box-containing protein
VTPDALLDLFVLSPVGMVALDDEGQVEVANPAADRLLQPFLQGRALSPFFDAIAPWAGDLGARARAFPEPQGVVQEGLVITASDGAGALLSLIKRAPGRFFALVADAPRLSALEASTRSLGAQLSAIDRGVRDYALYLVDANGMVLSWSESAERVHQRPAAETVGRFMGVLEPASAGGEAHVRDLLESARRNGWSEEEAERVRRDGTPFPAATVVAALEGAGSRFQVITRDLSERRRLEQLAQTGAGAAVDDLTGVATRRSFYDTAGTEISRARRYQQPLAVLLVDPDQLRELNEAHGTAFGDECLRTVAMVCRQESRNTDVIGRVGGEEFAVLLPSTELSGGLVLAERVRERMQRHVFAGDHRGVRCTVSVGVAELVGEAATVDALLGMAKTAVQRAKSAGRNLVVGLDDEL